jgi:small subunit ribosomal protein S5
MAEEEKKETKEEKPKEETEKIEENGEPKEEIVEEKELIEIKTVPVAEELPETTEEIKIKIIPSLERWKPKTSLGQDVFNGKITDINEILSSGKKILEPEIVDKLVPDLKNELILIGGRTGKGGGIQRIPVRITAAMHKSGRRFTMNAFVVVGNENGLVGIGSGKSPEARSAIEKANQKAKLNLINVKRGCGSWECECGEEHSVAYKIKGKSGSVRVVLLPAPKGVGLAADNQSKKILQLAGIKDIWVKTFGNTGMRINLVTAIYDALKKLYIYERS